MCRKDLLRSLLLYDEEIKEKKKSRKCIPFLILSNKIYECDETLLSSAFGVEDF